MELHFGAIHFFMYLVFMFWVLKHWGQKTLLFLYAPYSEQAPFSSGITIAIAFIVRFSAFLLFLADFNFLEHEDAIGTSCIIFKKRNKIF